MLKPDIDVQFQIHHSRKNVIDMEDQDEFEIPLKKTKNLPTDLKVTPEG